MLREPGPVLSRLIMPLVMIVLLRPLYQSALARRGVQAGTVTPGRPSGPRRPACWPVALRPAVLRDGVRARGVPPREFAVDAGIARHPLRRAPGDRPG